MALHTDPYGEVPDDVKVDPVWRRTSWQGVKITQQWPDNWTFPLRLPRPREQEEVEGR